MHDVEEVCLVFADVEGHPLEFQANVVDAIGTDEDGRAVDVLFGAIAMQLWGIGLDLQNKKLDFSHFSWDFVEFKVRVTGPFSRPACGARRPSPAAKQQQ